MQLNYIIWCLMTQNKREKLSKKDRDHIIFESCRRICFHQIEMDRKPKGQSDTISNILSGVFEWFSKKSRNSPQPYSTVDGAQEFIRGILYFLHKALCFVPKEQLDENKTMLIDNIYWKKQMLTGGLVPTPLWGLSKHNFKTAVRVCIINEASRRIVFDHMNALDSRMQRKIFQVLFNDSLEMLSLKGTPPAKGEAEEYIIYAHGIELMVLCVLRFVLDEDLSRAMIGLSDNTYWSICSLRGIVPKAREWGLSQHDIIDAINASLRKFAEKFLLKQADVFVHRSHEAFFVHRVDEPEIDVLEVKDISGKSEKRQDDGDSLEESSHKH